MTIADPILTPLLLATAEPPLGEPWEQWYGCTRLALADWLEEHGREAQAAMVRHTHPAASMIRGIDFSRGPLSKMSAVVQDGAAQEVRLLSKGGRHLALAVAQPDDVFTMEFSVPILGVLTVELGFPVGRPSGGSVAICLAEAGDVHSYNLTLAPPLLAERIARRCVLKQFEDVTVPLRHPWIIPAPALMLDEKERRMEKPGTIEKAIDILLRDRLKNHPTMTLGPRSARLA